MKLKSLVFVLILLIPLNIVSAKKSEVIEKVNKLCQQLIQQYNQKIKPTSKVNIAVMDFETTGEISKKKDLGTGVAEIISTIFTKDGNFRVIERKRLSKILKELELGLTGLMDDVSTKQVGRLLSADVLLTGAVSELGENYSISARIVDVETGVVQAASEVQVSAPELVPVTKVATSEMKYPVTALFRSALMPGWGSFYNDRPLRGWLYLGVETLAVSTGLYLYFQGKSIYRDYTAMNEDNFDYYVPEAKNPQEAAQTLYEDAQWSRELSNIALISALSVWFINICDAYITAILNNSRIREYEKSIAGMNNKPRFYAQLHPVRSEIRIGYKVCY